MVSEWVGGGRASGWANDLERGRLGEEVNTCVYSAELLALVLGHIHAAGVRKTTLFFVNTTHNAQLR